MMPKPLIGLSGRRLRKYRYVCRSNDSLGEVFAYGPTQEDAYNRWQMRWHVTYGLSITVDLLERSSEVLSMESAQ